MRALVVVGESGTTYELNLLMQVFSDNSLEYNSDEEFVDNFSLRKLVSGDLGRAIDNARSMASVTN